jgi:hypothetical protein
LRHDVLACGCHGRTQDVEIADVIGQQQHELRIHERALRVVELAVRIDERLVEVVRRRKVRVVMRVMMVCYILK